MINWDPNPFNQSTFNDTLSTSIFVKKEADLKIHNTKSGNLLLYVSPLQ